MLMVNRWEVYITYNITWVSFNYVLGLNVVINMFMNMRFPSFFSTFQSPKRVN